MKREVTVSVIIPTMWRSDCVLELVQSLLRWHDLLEIIIIDNAPMARPNHPVWSSCTILEQTSNVYVNPAWNLGVKHAKGELVAICNDDILFDPECLSEVIPAIGPNDIFGLHKESFEWTSTKKTVEVSPGHCIGDGWGCLLLFRKSTYVPIPHSIKIWFGDDWLVHSIRNKLQLKMKVSGSISLTAGDDAFDPIKSSDKEQFERFIWHFGYRILRLLSKRGIQWPLQRLMDSFNYRHRHKSQSKDAIRAV